MSARKFTVPVCSRYVEAPLLYRGLKFDVRLWAVIRPDPDSELGLALHVYRCALRPSANS